MIWLVRVLGGLLVLLTLLPLLPTGKWYVRWWDFPRLQIAMLLIAVLLVACCLAWRSQHVREPLGWSLVFLAAIAWQVSHVIPLSPLWPKEVPPASDNAATNKVMVVNLKVENSNHQQAADQIREEQPDILLLVEIDEAWSEGLSGLRSEYKYHHDEIRDEGLGMSLWTNEELLTVETRHVVSERRPSIWAELQLKSGENVHFVGVHPTPPGLKDSTGEERRDSRVRDAELILIAKEIAEQPEASWIVAGDFNDVAWSHTTRLFKRTSGLLDPRVGRSFMGTYIAQYPPCRSPIDHVFLSDGFTLDTLDRKRITGSDHFAVLVSFAARGTMGGVTPEPQGDDRKDAEEIIEEGKQDAEKRDLKSKESPSTE